MSSFPHTLPAPFTNAYAVSPSDSVDVDPLGNNILYVGTGGVIKVTTKGGQTVTMTVVAGIFPLAVTRVWAASLTAANIFLLT